MAQKASTQEEVERKVEEWHEDATIKVTLADYLGWTEQEYKIWLETNTLPQDQGRQING